MIRMHRGIFLALLGKGGAAWAFQKDGEAGSSSVWPVLRYSENCSIGTMMSPLNHFPFSAVRDTRLRDG